MSGSHRYHFGAKACWEGRWTEDSRRGTGKYLQRLRGKGVQRERENKHIHEGVGISGAVRRELNDEQEYWNLPQACVHK